MSRTRYVPRDAALLACSILVVGTHSKSYTRPYFFLRDSTYLSPSKRDWAYFFKRYIDLPPELRAHIIVKMAEFAPYNASLHPSFIVWVNHTEKCLADHFFHTQFGPRFHCTCPRAVHKSPLPIAGPARKSDPSCE